jgi:hypothetical protein
MALKYRTKHVGTFYWLKILVKVLYNWLFVFFFFSSYYLPILHSTVSLSRDCYEEIGSYKLSRTG